MNWLKILATKTTTKKMTIMIDSFKRFFFIAFVVDSIVILYSFFASRYFLLNSQLAFIASLLIVLGSFYGYARMVKKRAHMRGRDIIDEIEDRFELYEEPPKSNVSAKEIFEEEKAKIKAKRVGIKNFLKSSNAFFSPFRLFGYLVLVVAILFLVRHRLFEAGSFLVGLAVVPASAMLLALLPQRG